MSEQGTSDAAGNGHEHEASMTEKARRFGHEAVDAAAEKAETLERKVRAESDRYREKADAARRDTSEQIDETLSDIRAYIRNEPVKAAGIAFAAGVLAALILRR